jgi:hypothetical protein
MTDLVYQTNLGGNLTLRATNTASNPIVTIPAITGNMVTTGDTATVTANMIVPGVLSQTATYTQGSTGSVSRTIQNKLQESVSILDFGATLDGTTSDQTAFSNAINSGASQIIISGTCYLTASITVPSTTALQFSYGAKIKIASGQTLTIASQIIAENAPIFVDPYSVSFTGNQAQIKPKWLNL